MKKSMVLIVNIILMITIILSGCADKNAVNTPTNSGTNTEAPANTDPDATEIPTEKVVTSVKELDKNWSETEFFSEGLCAAKDKTTGLWGYVDNSGEYIIKPQYYEAFAFQEGLAAIKNTTGLYDFIDKEGTVVCGGYLNIGCRFDSINSAHYIGFFNGYGLATMDEHENDYSGYRKQFFLVDKTGKETKTDIKVNYQVVVGGDNYYYADIQLQNGIFYDYDYSGGSNTLRIFDNQYNEIASFDDARIDGENISFGLIPCFNISTKYLLLWDDASENIFAVDASGKIVFEQSKVPDVDFSKNCRVGISDDYVIVERTINKVQSTAIYDYDGNVVFDYKHKEIIPYSKDVFITRNNAGVIAIIDKDENELLPASLGLTCNFPTAYNSSNLDYLVSKLKYNWIIDGYGIGIMTFRIDDEIKHFDFQTNEIIDGIFTNDDSIGTNITFPILGYDTPNGRIYCLDKKTLLNSIGEVISIWDYYDFSFLLDEFNYACLKEEGIVRVQKSDGSGSTTYTFCVFE